MLAVQVIRAIVATALPAVRAVQCFTGFVTVGTAYPRLSPAVLGVLATLLTPVRGAIPAMQAISG